ncbi:MAG: hypothetical protein KDD44_10740, partial [Bdellovibrionales bacterium]|nr:hypothetical protein [Bdellovibrionales bacterium]
MKSRTREINIFSLSMMDVISGAMGAFLIIMIGLARYYNSDPTSTQTVQQMNQQLQEAKEIIDEMKQMLRKEGIDPEPLL